MTIDPIALLISIGMATVIFTGVVFAYGRARQKRIAIAREEEAAI